MNSINSSSIFTQVLPGSRGGVSAADGVPRVSLRAEQSLSFKGMGGTGEVQQ